MKIRTRRAAFVDGVLKAPGAIFEWPNDRPVPPWAVLVEAAPTPAPAPSSSEPQDALNASSTQGEWVAQDKDEDIQEEAEEPI